TVAAQVSNSDNGNYFSIPLEGLDGNPIYLEDYRDKVIVLEFMATWCITCSQQELVLINEFWPEYMDKDIVIISVSTDPTFDTPDVLRNHVEKKGITWIMTRDTSLSMTSYFQVMELSTILIISPDGDVMNTFKGLTDFETLSSAVENLL
ncbi:TlpA family protein disulfide reductase, partial [Thermoproteota archaeon]